MFSGIIEEKAEVEKALKTSDGCKLTVQSEVASIGARIGDSISVNGVCLTIVGAAGKKISFDIMEETLRMTNLSRLSGGDIVNLERSLKAGDRISGHFVTGHIDCIGRVRAASRQPNEYAVDIEFPIDKGVYLAEKGSIAVDGVSLTVAQVKGNCLRVCLIPLTLKTTNLGLKNAGDSVNIEFDILSKYVQQNSPPAKERDKIDADFLKEHGFL